MANNSKIVSASPYRAIIRRQEQKIFNMNSQTSRDSSENDEENDNEGANDDFERDNDPLDMGATSNNDFNSN